jgi:hypothetical protein
MAEPAGGFEGLLYAVAVTCPLPQLAIAVTKPVWLTLTTPGTFVAHLTMVVMSLVVGGCINEPIAVICDRAPTPWKSTCDGVTVIETSCWSCPQLELIKAKAAAHKAKHIQRLFIISPAQPAIANIQVEGANVVKGLRKSKEPTPLINPSA